MNTYLVLYSLHVGAVVFSGSFFAVRGVWMLMENPLLDARVTRVLPHIIDTVLLLAAVGLMIVTGLYPPAQVWITVKMVALLAYIGFGMMALRRGRTRQLRLLFFILAVTTFLFMVSVAFTKQPLGFVSWIAA